MFSTSFQQFLSQKCQKWAKLSFEASILTADRVSLLWKNQHFHIFLNFFQSNDYCFRTSHDSVNFFQQFKILLRFLEWKMQKLRFSNCYAWIWVDLTSHFQIISPKYHPNPNPNDFPTSEACFLQVKTVFGPKEYKAKEFDFEKSQFWPVLKPFEGFLWMYSWTFFKCLSKWLFWPNLLLQESHSQALIFSCMVMTCFVKYPWSPKLLLHDSHWRDLILSWNGFQMSL